MNKFVVFQVWAFLPNERDFRVDWKMPGNYIVAAIGETRIRLVTDTPLDDETLFQPGWKRIDEPQEYYVIDKTHPLTQAGTKDE